MAKKIDISKLINSLTEENDKESLNLLAGKIVETYPEQASSIIKDCKNQAFLNDKEVTITSARELSVGQKKSIETALAAKITGNVDFRYVIEPEIYGGLIIRQGEYVVDNCLRTRVKKLGELLG